MVGCCSSFLAPLVPLVLFPKDPLVNEPRIEFAHIAGEGYASFTTAFSFYSFSFVYPYYFTLLPLDQDVFCLGYVVECIEEELSCCFVCLYEC